MRRESNDVFVALQKGTMKYDEFKENFSLKQKENIVFKTIISTLLKKTQAYEIVSHLDKEIIKKLKIKNNWINKERVSYSWQDSIPKRKLNLTIFSGQKNDDLLLAAAYIKQGLIIKGNESSLYEVLVFNKDLEEAVSLKNGIKTNIEKLRALFMGNPKISLLNNSFNNLEKELIDLNVDIYSAKGESLLPIINVFIRKSDIFQGILSHDKMQWVAMACVAANVRCEIRQVYLEDMAKKPLGILNSSFVQRIIADSSKHSRFHLDVYTQSDICKNDKAQAFVVPIAENKDFLAKKKNKKFYYMRFYEKQVFRLKA